MIKHLSMGLLALAPIVCSAQTLAPSQDAHFVPGVATNFGTATTITVGSSSSVGLVQFDLSQLPVGVTAGQVQKATLTLFLDKVSVGGTINIDTVSNSTPWGELTVNGNSPISPGIAVATAVGVNTASTFISVDATSAVQNWIAAPGSNNGFIILANAATSVQFDSKENLNTSHPATLTIVLANSGPAGATGPVGPTGQASTIPGPAGPTGPTGAGATGAVGPTGAVGATGLAGSTGAPGATGSAGATGAVGGTGPAGATGAPGATGAVGATGLAGSTGAVGATGLVGPTGAIGATGPSGTAGTAGTNGAAGATGAKGSTGSNGATGTNGSNGATGATGLNGTNGANGSTGAAGATGAQGPSHAYNASASSVGINATAQTTVVSVSFPSGLYAIMATLEVANNSNNNNTSSSCQLFAGSFAIANMGTAGATGGAPVAIVGVAPLAVTSASVKCQAALGTATVFSPQIVAIQVGAVN